MFQSLVLLLAHAATKTLKTARNIGTTCYHLIHCIKFSPKQKTNGHTRRHTEHLMILISQIYHRPPKFSMFGFFDVDFRWVFVVLNTTMSYAVVVLYFFSRQRIMIPWMHHRHWSFGIFFYVRILNYNLIKIMMSFT